MAKTYYPTIGLEVHAELKTDSKMFCGCKNDPNEVEPNKNVCPVCMAHPGALPVPNKEAILLGIRVGLSLGSTIADFTEFDRKNYFYPDIPKGYQITQYKHPLVEGGFLAGVQITRVHLEEDTGTNKHDRGDYSLVNFNRAGVPLMELVTEPVIHTPEDAGRFARELQLLLRAIGASEANMEQGQMRVDANVSISEDPNVLGTKVEIKNINSFRNVERAIAYEISRLTDLHEKDRANEIIQETRGWSEAKQATFSQRSKEDARDYRYFPDPDIPVLYINQLFNVETIKTSLPELPSARRERYIKDFNLKLEDASLFVEDELLGKYFEAVITGLTQAEIPVAANFLANDITGLMREGSKIIEVVEPKVIQEIVHLFSNKKITSRAAKDLIALSIEFPKVVSVEEEATKRGMIVIQDEAALRAIAQKIITANEKIVTDYKGGKVTAIQGLVGQMMKETKGSADPQKALELFKELLS